MKVKVNPYQSVCYNAQWYNQGDVFECADLGSIKDQVTVIDAPAAPKEKQSSKKVEE